MALNDERALVMYDQLGGAFSRGAWLEALPLSNLLLPRLEFIARSVDLLPDNTQFRLVLRAPADLGAFYLGWTNLTPSALVTLSFLSASEDTLFGDTWNPIPEDPDPWRAPSVFRVLPEVAPGVKYIDVVIDDQANPAGYVQASLCYVGRHYQPSHNYSPEGNGLSFKSNAIVSPTLSAGADAVWDRPEQRVWRAPWQNLDEDEVYGGEGFAALRAFRRGARVVVFPEPDASPLVMQRKAMLAEVTSRDALTQSAPAYDSFGLEFTEVMGPQPVVIVGAHVLVATDVMIAEDYPTLEPATIAVPADAMLTADYLPLGAAGAGVKVPNDAVTAGNYAVRVAIGAIARAPLNAVVMADFSPESAAGASASPPADAMLAENYALSVRTGTTARLTVDVMFVADYPIFGAATVIDIPTDEMETADYAPAVLTGVRISVPADLVLAVDYPAAAAGGAVVKPPVNIVIANDYSTRTPEFSSAFDGEFK